jgi:AraC-like DNA-binding protein
MDFHVDWRDHEPTRRSGSMTARANSLTARVSSSREAGNGLWSMTTGDVRVLLHALTELGHDVGVLLERAGVSPSELDDPDRRVSCEAVGTILSVAQRARFTPNIGFELARLTPFGSYPLLDYLVATSESVAAGVVQLARYMRLVGNPTEISAHEDNDHIRVEIRNAPSPFSVEYSVSLMVLHLRTETEGGFAATYVCVRHVPDDEHAFARGLGCEVRSRAAWDGLVFPAAVWQRPLRRRDSVLRRFLETHADQMLAQLAVRPGVAAELQRALARNLSVGSNSIGTFARQFAMSGRTLQRRLAAEGVSYQQVVDSARKEAAARYLTDSTLAICEVAYLVGYSEPAPFHRAFKRWYGMTPDSFRARLTLIRRS